MFEGDTYLDDVSPEPPCFCPQTAYEPQLLDAARSHPSVSVEFERRVTGIEQTAQDVTVEVVGGGPSHVRCRYLVAADGASSSVRQWLDLTQTEVPAFGHSVNVHFRADLSASAGRYPYMLFWLVGVDAAGTLARASSDDSTWTWNFPASPGTSSRRTSSSTGSVRPSATRISRSSCSACCAGTTTSR